MQLQLYLSGLRNKSSKVYLKTSVSKTIRKPPLVKAQTALKKTKKYMAKNDFQYGGWNYYALQCGTIDFAI